MTVKTQQFYYNLLLQGYMFRLLRVIIRPNNELTQDYFLVHSGIVLGQFIRGPDDDQGVETCSPEVVDYNKTVVF
jgi:hypothetical protein